MKTISLQRVVRLATLFLMPFVFGASPSAYAERDGGSESHGGDPLLVRQANLARFVEQEGVRLLVSALRAVPLVDARTSRRVADYVRTVRFQARASCPGIGAPYCVPVSEWVMHGDYLSSTLTRLLRVSLLANDQVDVDQVQIDAWEVSVRIALLRAGTLANLDYLWAPLERGVCLVNSGNGRWRPALNSLNGAQDLSWPQCILEARVLTELCGSIEALVQFYPASGRRVETVLILEERP